jgi:hypothetical protein
MEYVTISNTIEDLKNSIQQNGVGVLKGVISKDECKTTISKMHEWLNYKPKTEKIELGKPETWRNISKILYANHGGLIQHFDIGQAQFSWDLRQKQEIKSIFEKLWDTKDLIVSFDGSNITPPPEVTNLGWNNPNKLWLHTDQSPKKVGLCSIQGLVNLEDVDEGDATLLVLKGSNNYHAEFFAEHKVEAKGDWYKLNDEEMKWFINKGCKLQAIKASAGDMIFWDSRTIHMGVSPSKGRKNADRWRYVVYIAMFPRSFLTSSQLKKRIGYFKDGRTTNHWGNKLFPKLPRTYGGEISEMNPYILPELSEIGKSLI